MDQVHSDVAPPFDPEEFARRGKQIGKLLSDKRIYYELSLRECAERIGTSRQRYAAIEAGATQIELVELEEIMRFLFIEPDEIWPDWGKGLASQELITKLQISAGQKVTIVVEGLESDR